MADVYIIYAGEDKEVARRLHGALSTRWSVWWDEDIVGSFPKAIEREMPNAGCVVYVNSAAGRVKDTIIDELGLAGRHERTIIIVRLDETDAPYPFGRHSSVSLKSWMGDEDNAEFKLLIHKISHVIQPSKSLRISPTREKIRRPQHIFQSQMRLPSVFMSISSYETQLQPEDAISLSRVFGARTVLISAYDCSSKNNIDDRSLTFRKNALSDLKKSGSLILMDSGNYEATRKKDRSWQREDYAKVLATVPHDIACSFDLLPAPADPTHHFDALVAGIRRDATLTSAPIVPIVHSPRLDTGIYDLENLPQLLCDLAQNLHPLLLAVPERELGDGLIERVRSMQRIRQTLDTLPFYQPVHLLGTGNPWSIAALAAAGADSFDGLEWCRVVVDRDTQRLNHFQHYDMFAAQAAVSPIAARLKVDEAVPFAWRAALHNLDYYADLTGQLQSYASKDRLETLVTGLLGNSLTRLLTEKAPGLFE